GAATAYNGVIADNQLSGNIARLNSNLTFTGAVQLNNPANSFSGVFSGNGSSATNVNLVTANSAGAITWTASFGNFALDSSPTAGLSPSWVVVADVNGDAKSEEHTSELQ